MIDQPALTLLDIPWLRKSAAKAGASDMPVSIATRLLAGKFVERAETSACLKITKRGELALQRLS